ncbi:MAG: hypothetical protein P4L40_12750 [Terracidiphilus sp.]|nr:hypothetical protein [Terracidiphilus sp.]
MCFVVPRQFGGATPVESNTFYSNGSDDPWQRAAVAKVCCCVPTVTVLCSGLPSFQS